MSTKREHLIPPGSVTLPELKNMADCLTDDGRRHVDVVVQADPEYESWEILGIRVAMNGWDDTRLSIGSLYSARKKRKIYKNFKTLATELRDACGRSVALRITQTVDCEESKT